MKQSTLHIKTQKEVSKDIQSKNAQLLLRAGFIQQRMAGIYAYYPLGLRVIQKISNIIREELNTKLEAQEVLLPALHGKADWETTGRWDTLDVLFKTTSQTGQEYAIGPTHEEQVVPFMQQHIASYKDLPQAVYQIQTKFRDELRAKSGLLRGREFLMKDLYSFHTSEEDLNTYYKSTIPAYHSIFERCGLTALLTEADGGTFSKYSHEFQVVTESGEDTIYHCDCGFAQNEEIITEEIKTRCPRCQKDIQVSKASEVGNIFELKTKYSKPFKAQFVDDQGKKQDIIMGCYGIGISRLMGVIAEQHNDENGLIWPKEVAPFQVHLLQLDTTEEVEQTIQEIYTELQDQGIEVLLDDRTLQAGQKFKEADLIGIPIRLVCSKRTEERGIIELKHRAETKDKTKEVPKKDILEAINTYL